MNNLIPSHASGLEKSRSRGRRKKESKHRAKRRILLEMLEARILRAVDIGVNVPDAVDEGQTLTLDGWYTSGDGASSAPTLTVAWGDGVTESYSLAENTSACVAYAVDHIYADDGSYAVAVTLYDDTGSDFESANAVVNDSGPSLSYSMSDISVEISETVSVSGDYGHPNPSETVTLMIDWGDGTTDAESGYPGGSFDYGHAYSSPGSYNVTVTATDDDGDTADGADGVQVGAAVDEAPTLTANLSATSVDEGDSVTLSGAVDHPESSESISLLIDWGDGSSDWLSLSPGDSYNAAHQYADDGAYAVTVTATDDDGDTDVETDSLNVANVAPTVTLEPVTLPIDEGGSLTISGTYDDPGLSDTHTLLVEIDLNGDGDYADDGESHEVSGISGGSFSYDLVIDDDGAAFDSEGNRIPGNGTSRDIVNMQVKVSDDDGGEGVPVQPHNLTVNNIAPAVSLEPTVEFEYGLDDSVHAVTVTAMFEDPGYHDEHTVEILWGDDETSVITLGIGMRFVQVTRMLDSAYGPVFEGDIYPKLLTIADDDDESVFVSMNAAAINKPPEFRVFKGPYRVDMRAHAHKTVPEVTALVKQELLQKLADIAGEPLPNVRFLDGSDLHDQSPNTAHGEAGFVIGWKRDVVVSPPDDDGVVRADFSSSKIAYFPYTVLYSNNPSQRPLVFSDSGLTFIESGPANTNEHEAWHATGVPRDVYDRWANLTLTRHKKILADEKRGFWDALRGAHLGLFNEIRFAEYQNLGTAQAGFNDLIEDHFASAVARGKIAEEGYWHTDVKAHNGSEVYHYYGNWSFAD